MKDESKTKKQLISELVELRQRMAELEETTKRSVEELKQINELLQLQIKRMPIGLIIWDTEFRIQSWNPAAEKIFGFGAQEVTGKHPYDLIVPKEVQPHVDEIWSRLLEGELTAHSVNENRTKDGRTILCDWWNTPLRKADGTVTGVLSMVQDITERKVVEEALKRHTAELERSNQELEQFVHVAAHDLQEPLRMVVSYMQLLARRYKGRLDADADEFITYAVDGATRMQQMINALLTYSQVRLTDDDFKPTDSAKALEGALANLRLAIEGSGAVVTYDPLPKVMASEVLLTRLFQNLIDNSVKFRSDKPPRIHVSAKPEKKEWVFSVSDNGIGIDPQHRDRMFTIFQRLHTGKEYPGTGIGLAICKRIVELYGGRIWVESPSGQGATFYFTIPIKGR